MLKKIKKMRNLLPVEKVKTNERIMTVMITKTLNTKAHEQIFVIYFLPKYSVKRVYDVDFPKAIIQILNLLFIF